MLMQLQVLCQVIQKYNPVAQRIAPFDSMLTTFLIYDTLYTTIVCR